MNFNFERDPESGVILVGIFLDGQYRLKMLLDTGASHTTIDSNELYMADYDLSNTLGTMELETANGIIQAEIFEIQEVAALGISRKNFSIQIYDFLKHGIISKYQGLLGMDFFEGTKFCIDTLSNQITIEELNSPPI